MPIDNLSKITSRSGINTTILLEAGNANVTGIITAAGFDGPFTGGGGNNAGIVTAVGGLHVGTAGTVLHAINDSDVVKVGIGTTIPTAKLEISHPTHTSLVRLKRTTGNAGDFVMQIGGSNPGVIFDAVGISSDFIFQTQGNEIMRIDSLNKEVGIGTDNPFSLLDVFRKTTGTNKDIFSVRSHSGAFLVQCSDVAASNPSWALRTFSGEDLVLSPGGNADVHEKVRIKASDGSVGIGSTDPRSGFKLDVNGDLSLGESGGTDNTYLEQKQNGDLHIINSGRDSDGASGVGGAGGIGINRYNTLAGGTSNFRDFAVYNGKNSKVLVVDGSASAVGIGTDAPDGALTIAHSGSSTDFLMFNRPGSVGTFARMGHNTSGGTNMLDIRSEGNTRFLTGGNNERLRIDSSGVITLGNITNTVLQASICNSVSGHQFISQCDDNNNGFEIYQKHGSTSTRNTLSVHANTGTSSAKKTQFVVRGDGKVGINPDASGPDKLLHVSDTANTTHVIPFRLTNAAGSPGTEVRMEFECGLDEVAYIGAKNEGSDIGPLMFATATSQSSYPTEKARINPGGSLTVGTTNDDGGGSSGTDDGCVLRKDGLIAARVTTGTNNVAFTAKTTDTGGCNGLRCMSAQTEVGGVSFNSGGTSFNQSSDYRRKENIVDLTGAITRLKTLSPKRFNFKTEPGVTRDGFLAHEVTTVPEAVTGAKDAVATENDVATNKSANVGDPIYQLLDQSKLVPLLTAALQEAVTKIETLETKVAALEGG